MDILTKPFDVLDAMVATYSHNGRMLVVLDSLVAYENGYDSWDTWVTILRHCAFVNQCRQCFGCGEPLTEPMELHHALWTKNDVKGMKDRNKANGIIQHSFNVVMVHKHCHELAVRVSMADALAAIYGFERVYTWYDKSAGYFRSRQKRWPGGKSG